MENTRRIGDSVEALDGHTSARRRLYIICQAAGWVMISTFITVSFFELQWPVLKPNAYPRIHPVEFIIGRFILPPVLGFLLTHYVRYFLTRWGWKRLDWHALLPRIFLAGAVLTLIFITLITANDILLLPNPAMKYGRLSLSTFLLRWGGNSPIFCGWLGIYFFYHLSERFNRLENERLRLVTSQQEAELRALKSQVNPHFIFNSLNSLRSLIEEEPARARLAVTQLANLLRYSLQSSQRETVPLEEELRVANDYLALEQVRYEDRLRLRIDVSPQALALPVPPMLLQTLVENAVKYGIAQRREGGEIAIVVRYDGDMLRLQVTNPRAPDASIKIDAESTGVGLRNAAERLRLLFSDRATLQLRLDGPDLVVAEVLIPIKPSPSRLP
jgi:hypothetical protein